MCIIFGKIFANDNGICSICNIDTNCLCYLYSTSEILKKSVWKSFAYKLILFGLGIYLIVPVSVKVSDMIEKTYQTSIEQTIDSAKQTTDEIKDSSNEEESSGVSGFISKVKDGVSNDNI